MKRLEGFQFPVWTVPVMLLLLGILCFGLLVSELGFYWDDWAKTLVNVLYGMSGYLEYYAEDRPYSGWTHVLFVSLLGNDRVLWQILNLVLRWGAAWGMVWCFNVLWPQARREVTLAAVIFMVAPVFTQQPIAVTFHQQWLQYVLYFISLGLMIRGVRKKKFYWVYTLLSLFLMAVQLTVTEYFIGVELLRPLVIWFLCGEEQTDWKQRIIETLKRYLPYLIFSVGYILWRMFLMPLSGEDPYRATTLFDFFQSPVQTVLKWSRIVIMDMGEILFGSWKEVVGIGVGEHSTPILLFSWGVGLASMILLAVYFLKLKMPHTSQEGKQTFLPQAALLGIAAIVLGTLPGWLIGRSVLDDFHSNRYALPGMFGMGLLAVVISDWLSEDWRKQVVMLSVLAGMAVGFQVRTVNDFRWAWKDQQQLYWQLNWRAPYLKPGTAVFFENEPFPNQGLFSTSSALNLLYPQDENPHPLGYWAYTLLPRYVDQKPNFSAHSLNSSFRSLNFEGKVEDSILLHFDPQRSNCWWLLGPQDALNPYLSDLEKDWLVISNSDRIEPDQKSSMYPPRELFGAEPEHGWCYLYQKAELASQFEDWETVVDLNDQAQAAGYSPDTRASNVPREWMPFIKGLLAAENWQEAKDLTLESYRQDRKYGGMLCDIWSTVRAGDEGPADVKDEIMNELGCMN